ncbi:uncharacterized protein SCHCODRAFT_02495434 [Schizophyllum commune H4-8]|uniref:Expressed protein n=1 Tax=Schizophyllum commune (strain H4-8 / FGSC 9210) TaxID=578458 RepID=D8Q1I7_SCHCM|nr:uncharacterized protein SCHCODRAFT_02495434 [Schizophyllum commune H4-8]KAI5895441.1 hypothetical protein SCHCODRAFT_02495434 [Schizophyllum commune H4-8]
MLAIGLLPACRCHPALAGRLPVPTRSLIYPVHPSLSYPRSLPISPYLTAHPKFVALLLSWRAALYNSRMVRLAVVCWS